MLKPVSVGLCLFALNLTSNGADKASFVVRAVSTTTETRTSTTSTPGSAHTTCSPTGDNVNCSTTYDPPTTRENVTARIATSVVEGNGQIYTLRCMQWAFGGWNCGPLKEGEEFQADTDGKTMWIQASRNGNQGKRIRVKFQILDVRYSPIAQEATAPTPAATALSESTAANAHSQPQSPAPPIVRSVPPLPAGATSVMKNEDVLRLKALGFSDELIVASIKAAKKTDFKIAVDDLAELRRSGLTEAVLMEMLTASDPNR